MDLMLIKLTDSFGLSSFSGKNLAHGILNALGMIPGLGDVADLINAAWYLHDKDYKNAALSALSALPAVGEFAGLTFLAKALKAAKYVKLTTKVIGHGSTFALAASGGINSAIQVYHNTREGKFFTIQNLMDVTNVGLSVFTMICSGKQTFESGRELAGMLKQDVPAAFSKAKQALSSTWSSIKNQAIRLCYDTGGFVDLDVLKEPISFRNSGVEGGSDFYVTPGGTAIPKENYHSMSNVDVRKWYLSQEAKIPDLIDTSQSLENQAFSLTD